MPANPASLTAFIVLIPTTGRSILLSCMGFITFIKTPPIFSFFNNNERFIILSVPSAASTAKTKPFSITIDCPISLAPIIFAILNPVSISFLFCSLALNFPNKPLGHNKFGNISSGEIIIKPSFSRALVSLESILLSPLTLELIVAKNFAVHKSGIIFFNEGLSMAPTINICFISMSLTNFIARPIFDKLTTKSGLYFFDNSSACPSIIIRQNSRPKFLHSSIK